MFCHPEPFTVCHPSLKFFVIPAKAGIQECPKILDSRWSLPQQVLGRGGNDNQRSAQRWMTTLFLLFSPLALAASLPPISLTDVAQRGLPILIDTLTTDVELDVPLLAPDGNILHLLGTAHPRSLPNPAFVEVTVDLVGATQPDCTAHVEILVDAATHRSLAQKLKLNCLGQTIHDAFVGGVK